MLEGTQGTRVVRAVGMLLAGAATIVTAPAMAQSGAAPQPMLTSPNTAPDPAVTTAPGVPGDAATAPAVNQNGLGEIIVTATRRAENLQDVPISISAIGAAQLASRGVTTSNDLGAVVPNLQVSSQYGETQPNFSLRGVGVANEFAANTASPIGVYVDEVNQTFRYTHGLQLYDLDRVEVVRGPQGTLFGRNTTGGAVSIFTTTPKLGAANGYITGGYGNLDRYKIAGAVEVTPVEDKVGVRVAFTRSKGDGYFREPNRANNIYGSKSYGGVDDIGVRATLRFKPSDKLDITIKGFYAKDDPIGYPLQYIGLVPPNGTDAFGSSRDQCCSSYKQVSLDRGGKFITKSKGFSANIKYDLTDNISVTSVTGYTKSSYLLNLDNDGTPQDVYTIRYDSSGKDFSQDFRVGYDSEKIKGIIGLYYGKDSIRSDNQVRAYNVLPDAQTAAQFNPGVATSLNVAFGYKQKRRTFAVYGEGTYNITPKLGLTLGGRYTKDHVDFLDATSTAFSDFPGVPLLDLYRDLNLKNSYDNISGRAIVNYAWTDQIKTYASFSRGYRSATYNGFGFLGTNAVYFVKPEKLDSYEAGFKTRFLNDRLQLNGAGFHYNYTNQQVQEVVGGVAFLRSLSAKVNGAELEVLFRPVRVLTLRSAIGFLDTKYNKNNPLLSGVSIGGNELPFASKWTVSGGGDLTVARIHEGDLVLSAEVAYKSRFFYDPFNDQDRPNPTGLYGPTDPARTNLVQSKGYAIVNGRISYIAKNFSVGFWAKNLFDKEYFPFGYDTAGAFGSVLLTPGAPRTYGGEATIKF